MEKITAIALGNPLIDISVLVLDEQLHTKYKVPLNGQIPVSSDIIRQLDNDIKSHFPNLELSPGGCVQNTIRIFQYLTRFKSKAFMVGSVGNDEHATYLENKLSAYHVKTYYSKLLEYRTSSVYILIKDDARCAMYDAINGAAAQYSLKHLMEDTNALSVIQKCDFILQEAFFTFHSPDVGIKVTELGLKSNSVLVFNLSGEYVLKTRAQEAVIPFIRSSHIVVGNLDEFNELFKVLNIDNLETLNNRLTRLYEMMIPNYEINSNETKIANVNEFKKIIIVTDGPNPIHYISGKTGFRVKHVPKIDKSLIKDTTGAGDAFIAGIIYGLVQENTLDQCVELGISTASKILQNVGCTFPI